MKKQKFTFKGEANNPGPRWHEGFNEAYELCSIGLPITAGKYGENWGRGEGIGDTYGNGFAEGALSGRVAYAALVGGHNKAIISE